MSLNQDAFNLKNEHNIQKECVRWFREEFPQYLLFSVPNEAIHTSSHYYLEGGARLGVADVVVLLRKRTLFVEFKTVFNYQSPQQIEFQKQVEELGYVYAVVHSREEFEDLILNNLPFSEGGYL